MFQLLYVTQAIKYDFSMMSTAGDITIKPTVKEPCKEARAEGQGWRRDANALEGVETGI